MWKVYASIPNHTYPETIHIKNYFAPDSSLVDSISFDVGDTIEIYTSGLDTIYILWRYPTRYLKMLGQFLTQIRK